MIIISNIQVHSYERDYLDITWELENTFEDVDVYEMYMLRSESEEGPYDTIAGPFEDLYRFRDTTAQLLRRQRTWFYRIRVVHKDTRQEAIYPELGGASMRARPVLDALEKARQYRLMLQEHGGRYVALYPVRTFGQRCTCVDPRTDRVIHSPCATCFGTRFVGGYHRPVISLAQIITPGEIRRATRISELNPEVTWALMTNYPEVQPGWMIVEPKENVRWIVGNDIRRVQRLRYTVRQQAQVKRIELGDVEYKVPLLGIDLETFEPSPLREFTNPRTMESVGAAQRAAIIAAVGATGGDSVSELVAAKNLNTTDSYLKTPDGIYTNISGYVLPYDATLIGIGAATDGAETWTAEIRKNGLVTPIASLDITNTATGFTGSLSVDVNAGDEIQMYCNGTGVGSPVIIAAFQRR